MHKQSANTTSSKVGTADQYYKALQVRTANRPLCVDSLNAPRSKFRTQPTRNETVDLGFKLKPRSTGHEKLPLP